jgi:hypothetical protein
MKVFIALLDIGGMAVVDDVCFKAEEPDRVQCVGHNIVLKPPTSIRTGRDGKATIQLMPGRYRVSFAHAKETFSIEVPVSKQEGFLTDLIV